MNARTVFALGFAATAAALAFAYYLEYVHGLEPCPLCIFQRVAMAAAGLAFLAGTVHGAGRTIHGGLAALAAAAGAAIAGRHVWLQSLPKDQVPACGPDLNYLLDVLPWTEVLSRVLRGDAACADIDASFLGLSLPAWTLAAFVGLALWALLGIKSSNHRGTESQRVKN
jgi:disulfide bond formation protein DsbB